MLTGRGITLLLGVALAWLVGWMLGIAELYAVAVACAAVVAIGVVLVRQATGAVSARRIVARERVLLGEDVGVVLELRNDARVPSPSLLVAEALPEAMWADGQPEPGTARFVVGPMGPGRVAPVRYTVATSTRGRYPLGPVAVRLRDPFGVAERVRRYTTTSDVVVYPHIERLDDTSVRGTHMGSGSSDKRRVMAGGEEFYTIREYVRGDDLRAVHWPSTAHRQTLMVRQMEQPWQAHCTLHLDTRKATHTGGRTGTLEKAVSVAATLVYHLADRGYAVRLVTDADAGRGGPQPWEQSLDRLAVLEASGNAGLGPSVTATRGGEGLFVSVLGVPAGRGDPASHPDLRALFGVRGFGQRIAVVVAPDPGSGRVDRTVALLAAAGWHATAIAPDQPFAPHWPQLNRPAGHGTAPQPTGVPAAIRGGGTP